MAGNQNMVFFFRPVVKPLLGFVFPRIIFGRAGRVENAEMFQWLPQIADKETGQPPEGGIEQIRLVAMGKINVQWTAGS